MLTKDISGLKFPDEYLVKFFFKESLDRNIGRVLELGCGNGNNLMLFYHYGWDVTGVDICKTSIEQGKNNFDRCRQENSLKNESIFRVHDMVQYCKEYTGEQFDVLLLPSSIYYLEYADIAGLFNLIRMKRTLKNGSLIFIRVRTPRDYRYNRGQQISEKSFRLKATETGEYDCICTFLWESELIAILEDNFILDNKHILHVDYDNDQKGFVVANHDVVFWARINKVKESI